MSPGAADLPWPLASWALGLLGELPAAEARASCNACPMCAPDGAAVDARRVYFSQPVRCCTYRPALPNYAVGAILLDDGPAATLARESVLQRIAEGDATPLGLRIDAAYGLVYRHAQAASFGRARALRCPHLAEGGGCGIWAQRPAVCATWFCKHERGQTSARMWQSLHQTLAAAEQQVSLHCLQALGLDAERQRQCLAAAQRETLDAAVLDRQPDPAQARALWGDEWRGREQDFFIACAGLAGALDWSMIERLGGQALALQAEESRALARLHHDLSLPRRLRAGSFEVLGALQGRLWLRSYSAFDTLELAPELMGLLVRCDGRDTESICAEHAAHTGQRPPRVLLRMLLDFGLLEPA